MPSISLRDAMAARRSCRTFNDHPVPMDAVRRMIWAAEGVTDDKGNRTVPSAHALHPLRLRLTAGRIEGMRVATYAVGSGAGDLTDVIDGDQRATLERAALEAQPWIGKAAGIITICADLAAPVQAFIDQPPYGTRGLRYVHIEAGAAAQNIHLQAVAEGLGCVLVAGFRDEATAAALALDAPVSPLVHMCFGWPE